jgi:hypothetical protein
MGIVDCLWLCRVSIFQGQKSMARLRRSREGTLFVRQDLSETALYATLKVLSSTHTKKETSIFQFLAYLFCYEP